MNLFKAQSDLFHRIISPARLTDPATGHPLAVWKVLVFDDNTSSLMSSFKIGDLRESNITLHLNSRDKKEPISGVEAIYVISPESESIRNCIRDIEQDVFSSVFLNFVGAVEKKQLSFFCDALVKMRKTYVIQEIKQFAIDFAPITTSCFSLGLPQSFANESAEFEDALTVKLLSFFATLECVPLLGYEKTNERLKRVHHRLSESVEGKENRWYLQDFEKLARNNKTLMVLHDATEDASAFLFQSFDFFPLIVDTLGLFQDKTSFYSAKKDEQKVTVDLKNDKFFQKNMRTPYPEIGLLIHNELEAVKEEHDRILKRPDSEADQLTFAENFSDVLEAVPLVTEKQKNSENHVKIATLVSRHLQTNMLEKVCVLSEQLWRNKRVSSEFLGDLEEVLTSAAVPKREKLRLFCLLSLNWNLEAREYQNYEVMLSAKGGITEQESALLTRLRDQKYANMSPSGGFLANFKNTAIQKLKNMTSEKYRTKITSSLGAFFKKRDLEDLKIASLSKSVDSINPDGIGQVIVVAVNGGNITEMFELMDLRSQLKKDIVYGMSELLTGKQFLEKVLELKKGMES